MMSALCQSLEAGFLGLEIMLFDLAMSRSMRTFENVVNGQFITCEFDVRAIFEYR